GRAPLAPASTPRRSRRPEPRRPWASDGRRASSGRLSWRPSSARPCGTSSPPPCGARPSSASSSSRPSSRTLSRLGAPSRERLSSPASSFLPLFVLPPCRMNRGCDHTIATVPNRDERIRIDTRPEGLTVEIRPFARTRRGRGWLAAAAVVVLAAAVFGASHLADAWEAGFRAGRFTDLPLPVLIALTFTVAVSTPLAFIGISALAFAEETISVSRAEITITTAAFERVRVRRIRRPDLRGWKQTYLP